MKTTVFLLLGLLLLVAPAEAQDNSSDGYDYSINAGATTITLTNYTGPGGNVTVPTSINGLTVTSIGEKAFYENYGLGSIILPNSVTSIGVEAFYNCTGLSSITLSTNLGFIQEAAFEGCTSLTSVTLPDSVTNTGTESFAFSGLTNITIGSGFEGVGAGLVARCYKLTTIIVSTNNPLYGSIAGVLFSKDQTTLILYPGGLTGNYTVPGSVTSIGDGAFQDCTNLSGVTIPNSVTSLGHSAFEDTGLTNITIPNSITFIDYLTFYECIELTNVVISDRVTNIQSTAFQSSGLINLTIPNSVTFIDAFAFQDCPNLTSVTLGANVNTIGEAAFNNCPSLTHVTIPASVTNFVSGTFAFCTSLMAVNVDSNNPVYSSVAGVMFDKSFTTLLQFPEGEVGSNTTPSGVTSIASVAFGGSSLTNLIISDGVTNIDSVAFQNASLSSITIAASVTTIGDGAFYDSDYSYHAGSLSNVYFLGNAPAVGSDVFEFDDYAKGYYLPGTSGWSSPFAGIPMVMLDPPNPAGSLEVIITPAGATNAGAQWQVDGGILQPSGATVLGLTVGAHTVGFTNITGWMAPSNLTVTIKSGATAKATGVYIQNPKGNPTLTITSPKSSQSVVGSNNLYIVTGATTDKVTVTNVAYQFNGGSWVSAIPSNSWSNWSAGVTLNSGANTIKAYAQDMSGSISPTTTVKFQFFPSGPLMVVVPTNENGTVTPNETGKLLGFGTNYTLTAKPGNNWLFSNWAASGGGSFVSTNPALKFTMQSNLIVTANFVTNPFIGMAGRYDGVFFLSDSQGVTEESSGLIESLVLKTNGVYSGKMYLAGTTIPLAGTFNNSGQTTEPLGSIAAAGGKVTLQLNVIFQKNPREITGLVEGTGWTSSNLYLIAATTNTNNFPAYTMLLPQDPNQPGNTPPGYGYALVTNTGSMINFGGVLADGTPFSRSDPINELDQFPVYANLYSNKGLLLGTLSLASGIFGAVPSGGMAWIKPSEKTGLYPNGFSTSLGSQGSPWTNSTAALAALTNAMQLTISGGGLASNLAYTVQLTPSNTLKKISGSAGFYSGALNRTNGLLSVTFTNSSKQRIIGYGTVLQNTNLGGGFFLGTNQSGSLLLEIP